MTHRRGIFFCVLPASLHPIRGSEHDVMMTICEVCHQQTTATTATLLVQQHRTLSSLYSNRLLASFISESKLQNEADSATMTFSSSHRRRTLASLVRLTPLLLLVATSLLITTTVAFVPSSVHHPMKIKSSSSLATSSSSAQDVASSSDQKGDSDIVARRIVVTGAAVQGGYYRSCVLNEVCVVATTCIS